MSSLSKEMQKSRKSRFVNHSCAINYLYILGPCLFFAIFLAYPIVFISIAGLHKWNGVSKMVFVGLTNYAQMLRDRFFFIALRNNFYYIVFAVGIQMGLGLVLAVLLNEKLRGSVVIRTIFFLPCVIVPVVIALVWLRMYEPGGLITATLRKIGLGVFTRTWLGDPNTVIFAIIAVNIWEWTGLDMVIYLAGLQNIPDELYEVARIDGAGGIKSFIYITLPMLRGTHFALLILGITGTLKTFDLVWVLTKGGPYYSSHLLTTYIFNRGFYVHKMGYASALSIFLLILSLSLTIYVLRIYAGKRRGI